MNKLIVLVLALLVIGGSIYYFESMKVNLPDVEVENGDDDIAAINEEGFLIAPELAGISGYLNSDEIQVSDFRGKVVLIDFWTYTCINCIRTLPFLTEWDEKYRDKGLVIIGVHTPEFEFEKKKENVEEAIEKYGIEYRVVQDNDFVTWVRYQGGRGFWPRKYLIDKDGYIRYDHIGEGSYDVTENKIKELLGEIGVDVSDMDNSDIEDTTPRVRQTPELYSGYGFALPRGQNVGNSGGLKADEIVDYELPENIKKDVIYLDGKWKSNSDNLESQEETSIVLDYTAVAVNIVADALNEPLEMEVFIDGNYVNEEFAGDDVKFEDGKAFVLVDEARLYNVVRGEYGNHLLKLDVASRDFIFNAFTFG